MEEEGPEADVQHQQPCPTTASAAKISHNTPPHPFLLLISERAQLVSGRIDQFRMKSERAKIVSGRSYQSRHKHPDQGVPRSFVLLISERAQLVSGRKSERAKIVSGRSYQSRHKHPDQGLPPPPPCERGRRDRCA
jgi:hypothetical protein